LENWDNPQNIFDFLKNTRCVFINGHFCECRAACRAKGSAEMAQYACFVSREFGNSFTKWYPRTPFTELGFYLQ
jgi:hypothetical protein